MAKRRSRRLRKKLHIGEFQELGFCFETTIRAGIDEHALIDAFLEEAIVAHGLSFGGWVTGGAVEKAGRGSVSPEQRAQVLAWLKAHPDIETVKAGDLIDMWYSTGEEVSLTSI